MVKSTTAAAAPVSDDVQRLLRGEHANPHGFLGVHDGRVRVWRPDAATATIVGGAQLEQVHPAGLFEGKAPSSDYRIEAHYADGATHVAGDPYRFWPTVGDLDLHLFGEGRHHHLWRVLGCHLREHQGVRGASF